MGKFTPGKFTDVQTMTAMIGEKLSADKAARAYLLGENSKMNTFSPEETWALLASVALKILELKKGEGAVKAKVEREKVQNLLGIHPADMLHVLDMVESNKESFSLIR